MDSLKKIHFSILLVLFSLVLVEFFLRLLPEPPQVSGGLLIYNPELDFPEFYLRDPELFWRLRPGQRIKSGFVAEGDYRINSAGFRGGEFSEKKTNRGKRVLCLGNSVTFGWRVAEQEAYPQILQGLLPELEIYNCAQTGYSSFQGKRLLPRLLRKYRPEAVTISYIWNDLLPAAGGVPDNRLKMPPGILLSLQNLLGRTAAYRWVRYAVLRFGPQPAADGELARVGPADYAANLQALADSCRVYSVIPVFVLPPAPRPEWLGTYRERYARRFYSTFQRYATIMKKTAAESGVLLLDADSALASDLSIWENLPEDFVHPGAGGHRKLALLLEPALSQSLGNEK